jgi:hypothetical protein
MPAGPRWAMPAGRRWAIAPPLTTMTTVERRLPTSVAAVLLRRIIAVLCPETCVVRPTIIAAVACRMRRQTTEGQVILVGLRRI